MTRRRMIALCIVAVPILLFLSISLIGDWNFSQLRLGGLSEAEVVKLLGTPAYSRSHGRITTMPAQRDPLNFALLYYNHEGRHVEISFEGGKVVKVEKLWK